MIIVRRYGSFDAVEAMEIWNSVVREGIAFPQLEELTEDTVRSSLAASHIPASPLMKKQGKALAYYISFIPTTLGGAAISAIRVMP